MGYASADGDHQSKAHGESNRADAHILLYAVAFSFVKKTENFPRALTIPQAPVSRYYGRMKTIAIVTGASSGMGREFALQLARTRNLDEIWLVARRGDRLDALASDIRQIGLALRSSDADSGRAYPSPRAIPLDLAGSAGISRFRALLDAEPAATAGELIIDTLVNNAGFGTYGPFTDTPLSRELEIVELNVTALTGLCHLAVPFLGRGSRIINVASLASFIPLGNFACYAATKAYVLSLSVALAAELADRGIAVTACCPGPVDTEFANVASNGAREAVVDGKDPARVVAHALRAASRGKTVAIMALKWKFKAFMSRLIGRYFFARYAYVHEKRPSR